MREAIAFALIAAFIVFVAILCIREHQPQAYPLIQADAPRDQYGRQIRLFATCPTTPWALPKNEGVSQT